MDELVFRHEILFSVLDTEPHIVPKLFFRLHLSENRIQTRPSFFS